MGLRHGVVKNLKPFPKGKLSGVSPGFNFKMVDHVDATGDNSIADYLSLQQRAEVAEQRSERYETTRATVPAMEELLYHPIHLLDHGFLRVVDYMGDDDSVVQAARVSYGRGYSASV